MSAADYRCRADDDDQRLGRAAVDVVIVVVGRRRRQRQHNAAADRCVGVVRRFACRSPSASVVAVSTAESLLLALERRQLVRSYKVGLLYCGPDQKLENQWFGNCQGSPAFDALCRVRCPMRCRST